MNQPHSKKWKSVYEFQAFDVYKGKDDLYATGHNHGLDLKTGLLKGAVGMLGFLYFMDLINKNTIDLKISELAE